MGSLSQVSTLCRDLSSRSQARQLLGESGRDPTSAGPAGHWPPHIWTIPECHWLGLNGGLQVRPVKRRQDCSIKICDFGLQGGSSDSSGSHGGIQRRFPGYDLRWGFQWFFLGVPLVRRMAATRDLFGSPKESPRKPSFSDPFLWGHKG